MCPADCLLWRACSRQPGDASTLASLARLQAALAVGSTVVRRQGQGEGIRGNLTFGERSLRAVLGCWPPFRAPPALPCLAPPPSSGLLPIPQVFGDKYLAAFRLDFIPEEPASQPEAAAAPAEAPATPEAPAAPEAAAAPAPEQ